MVPQGEVQAGDQGRRTQDGSEFPLETQEKELILRALEDNLWVQKNAAKQLGISPRALNYKVNKFSITHPNWRKNK